MKRIKTFSITEEENPRREEWCSGENVKKEVDSCEVSLTARGLDPAEMRMISSEFRRILKNHGYDVTLAV
mgnify:CR=1 FL=1